MRPVSYSLTGTAVSPVFAADHYISPFNIALAVKVSGSITYTVQYTFDDVFANAFDPSTATWVDHPSLTSQTTAKDSNIAYPVRGIRLTTASGAGVATLTIIQAGGGGKA